MATKAATKPTKAAKPAPQPPMLAGGNPQIPKAHGDAPVQAYIAAMPGWKGAVGRRLDDIITRTVPDVNKAVKWNTPLYGMADQGWFLGFHCYTHYVKVTFFNGALLDPPPPGPSKTPRVRHLDVREDAPFDETRFADWVRQASRLPGERM